GGEGGGRAGRPRPEVGRARVHAVDLVLALGDEGGCAEQVGQLGGARHGSWVVNRQGGGEWARVPAKDSDEGIEGPVWPEQGEKVGRGPIRARGEAKKRQRPGGSSRRRTCRNLTQQPRQDSRKSRENSQATSRSVGCYLAKPGAPRKSAFNGLAARRLPRKSRPSWRTCRGTSRPASSSPMTSWAGEPTVVDVTWGGADG